MELFMNGICLALCLVLPLCWGSAWGYGRSRILKQQTKVPDCWLLDGWVIFLAGFSAIAVAVRLLRWSWHRLSLLGLLLVGILTAFFVLLLLRRSFRGYFRERLLSAFSKENRLLWLAGAAGFVLIGALYLWQGFTLELYHTLPEETAQVLGTGMLEQKTDFPAFYAFLAFWLRRRPEMILFQIMPYVWLCVLFDVLRLVSGFFLKKAEEKAFFVLAFVAVVLCGSGAHMNVPYAVLHAPYEGDALMGALVVPYLLGTAFFAADRGRAALCAGVRLILGLFCAYLFAGRSQGLLIVALELIVLAVAAPVWCAVRRKVRD